MRGLAATAVVWALCGPLCRTGSNGTDRRENACPLPIQLFEKRLGQRGVELVQQEVQAIWEPRGIAIVWTRDRLESGLLVVIDRPQTPLPNGSSDDRWNVAAVRYAEGHILPPVYASIDAAEKVARAACPPYSSTALTGIIVPRILGRAIAHELAHILLDTREHAATGLLRRRFSADELASPVRDPFLVGQEVNLPLDVCVIARYFADEAAGQRAMVPEARQ